LRQIVATLFCFLLAGAAIAQAEGNPFELLFRARQDSLGEYPGKQADPSNPFELRVRPAVRSPKAAENTRALFTIRSGQPRFAAQLAQIRSVATVVLMLLLAILLTLYRKLFARSYSSFFNDNLMFLFYREQEGRIGNPIWLLFLILPINLGLFAYMLCNHYKIEFAPTAWIQLGICLVLVLIAIGLKILVLGLMANLFSIEKEIKRYIFLILVFGVVLGVFLSPFNILLAYAPETLHEPLVYATTVLIGLTYLFRGLRALLLANKFIVSHLFHFLLYICTVEALPLLLFVKAILP
jgi:hypothetical protein